MTDQDKISSFLFFEKSINSGFLKRCCPGFPLSIQTARLALSFNRMSCAGFDCGFLVDDAWMLWLLSWNWDWCKGGKHQIFIVLIIVFDYLIVSLFLRRLRHFFWMNALNNYFKSRIITEFFWFCRRRCRG